jgi:hypothetical protein
VVVGKGIINTHILKEPADVAVKEPLDFLEIELGVDKYCT